MYFSIQPSPQEYNETDLNTIWSVLLISLSCPTYTAALPVVLPVFISVPFKMEALHPLLTLKTYSAEHKSRCSKELRNQYWSKTTLGHCIAIKHGAIFSNDLFCVLLKK